MERGVPQPRLLASGPLQTRLFPTWLHVEELISPRLLRIFFFGLFLFALHPPFFAACLTDGVLHKGKAKGGLGEERADAFLRGCVCWEEGGTDFEP